MAICWFLILSLFFFFFSDLLMPYFDTKTEMATVHEGMFRYKLVFFFWSEMAGTSPNRHRKRHNAYPPHPLYTILLRPKLACL